MYLMPPIHTSIKDIFVQSDVFEDKEEMGICVLREIWKSRENKRGKKANIEWMNICPLFYMRKNYVIFFQFSFSPLICRIVKCPLHISAAIFDKLHKHTHTQSLKRKCSRTHRNTSTHTRAQRYWILNAQTRHSRI